MCNYNIFLKNIFENKKITEKIFFSMIAYSDKYQYLTRCEFFTLNCCFLSDTK